MKVRAGSATWSWDDATRAGQPFIRPGRARTCKRRPVVHLQNRRRPDKLRWSPLSGIFFLSVGVKPGSMLVNQVV